MSTKENLTHPVVINALWQVGYTLDGRNAKGEVVNKDFFPKSQYKAALSLRKKIVANIKEEEGKTLIMAAELTLTDDEKKYIADCVKDREELPALDEAGLEQFAALTGVTLGE